MSLAWDLTGTPGSCNVFTMYTVYLSSVNMPTPLLGPLCLDDLRSQLEDWIDTDPKLKIVRLTKREGLIRARMAGADVAQGDVVVFLDSHCECNHGWLEPLLERIHLDRSTVVCPVIDNINSQTMEYYSGRGDVGNRGGFNWGLVFKWRKIPKYEMDRRAGDPSKWVKGG